MVVPNNHGWFPKNYHFGVFWGYHHLRKHPYDIYIYIHIYIYIIDHLVRIFHDIPHVSCHSTEDAKRSGSIGSGVGPVMSWGTSENHRLKSALFFGGGGYVSSLEATSYLFLLSFIWNFLSFFSFTKYAIDIGQVCWKFATYMPLWSIGLLRKWQRIRCFVCVVVNQKSWTESTTVSQWVLNLSEWLGYMFYDFLLVAVWMTQ